MNSNCTQRTLTARKRAKCRAREEAHFRVSVGKLTLLDNCILKSYVNIKSFFMLEGRVLYSRVHGSRFFKAMKLPC